MKKLLLLCAALLILGIANLPNVYYTLLRIVITVSAIYIVYRDANESLIISNVLFGAVAILFNPIFPVYLSDSSLWVIFYFLAATLFIVKLIRLTRQAYE